MDYATLKVVWWIIIGVLLIGFTLTDGFDMGVAVLMPFLGKNNDERRIIINAIGATWEGNQVWLITAGGAMFAAWPIVYAASFSGFYFAMLLVLFALFFRPVGFDYRSKRENPKWRNAWDWALFIGGFVPALVFGIAFGNLLQGVPFYLAEDLRITYTGSFWGLLNPFALLCGLVSLCIMVAHGAAFLKIKTEGVIAKRASKALSIFSLLAVILFAVAGYFIAKHISGFHIIGQVNENGLANPLNKTVSMSVGEWMANYKIYPGTIYVPIIAIIAGLLASMLAFTKMEKWSFVCTSALIIGVLSTAALSMFPFIMPSSIDPTSSLTVWDSTSSKKTLEIMLIAVIIFQPIILLYTRWVYKVIKGKVNYKVLKEDTHSLY